MKIITLTQNKFAKVDDDDFEDLSRYKWCYGAHGYAFRSVYIDGKRKTVYMHRDVNKTPDGFFTDHINGDKLDNTKKNLRTCTSSQNQMNSRIRKKKSEYPRGVYYYSNPKQNKKPWKASLNINGKTKYLGTFETMELALQARIKAEKIWYGEFSHLRGL